MRKQHRTNEEDNKVDNLKTQSQLGCSVFFAKRQYSYYNLTNLLTMHIFVV